jgi:chaperonin GroES
MMIEPLGPRVLIKPLQEEAKTASGIILPETAKEKPQQGSIEAVGDEDEMMSGLEVGDVVLFAKYSGNEFEMDGNTYIIMDEGDVLARIKK